MSISDTGGTGDSGDSGENDDWNPDDPDAETVLYDVSAWSIDQQAEVSAAFAELGLRHAWRGFEVAVPAGLEAEADAAFEALERRLGLAGDDGVPAEITEGETLIEYDLDEWDPGQLATLTTALEDVRLPHRFEGSLLLVPEAAEEAADELLDMVESGDMALLGGPEHEPPVNLDDLFKVARRLAKEPKDAKAHEQLAMILHDLNPERPPFGVQLSLWRRAGVHCQELGRLLGEGDEIAIVDRADQLEALVRPFV